MEVLNFILLHLLFVTCIFLCYWFFQIILVLPQVYFENNLFNSSLTETQLQTLFQIKATKESIYSLPMLLKPLQTYYYIFNNKTTSIVVVLLLYFLMLPLHCLSYFVYNYSHINIAKWLQLTFFLLFLIICGLSTFDCLVEYLPLMHFLCVVWFLNAFFFILIILFNYPSTKQMVASLDEKIINFYEIILFFIKKIFNK